MLDHAGSATYADNVEIVVGDGASLTLVSVHDWADDAVHLSQQSIKVGRDAKLKSIVDHLRRRRRTHRPRGAFRRARRRRRDARPLLRRRRPAPRAPAVRRPRRARTAAPTSTYKGALQGEDAHTVWIGDVLIRAAAEGTDTYELNRNLLLTDGARADSVPNLEIETGEIIGAGHASATGRFDDEQLFYLQSRGIPADEARRLVVRGFFADVINQIGIPEVQERLLAAVEAELEGAVH